jgi:4-hydroxy-tetrahydrodipicolinate synthase
VKSDLGELLTAMATPFDGDGAVDLDATRRLARHLVETGSDGVVVCGTTGEGPTLSDREKLDLFDAVVSEVGGSATVVANTGTYDTHHSAALTRSALETGVDAVMAVTPYYSKPPRAGLIAHFTAVAEAASGRPVVLYNIPQRVIVNLEPDVLIELSRVPNIVAVKQATTDLDQARRILAESDLTLYAGNDDLVAPLTGLGGAGGICVGSHVAGRRFRQMIDLARGGQTDAAAEVDRSLRPLYDALAVTTNPIPLKYLLNRMGLSVGGVRLPLVEATPDEGERMLEILASSGLMPAATA